MGFAAGFDLRRRASPGLAGKIELVELSADAGSSVEMPVARDPGPGRKGANFTSRAQSMYLDASFTLNFRRRLAIGHANPFEWRADETRIRSSTELCGLP